MHLISKFKVFIIFISIFIITSSCGNGPLFSGQGKPLKLTSSSGSSSSSSTVEEIPENQGNNDDQLEKENSSADSSEQTDNPTDKKSQIDHIIPDATPEELESLKSCLANFKDSPFEETITNFKKIKASINIGGSGTAINDTTHTDEPELILIAAAINVGSKVTYNLLNPNGYYCMMLNTNIKSKLTINLDCRAQVADSALSIQIKSSGNEAPSVLGVNVKSDVQVNDIRPEGSKCVR
ncbi:MAG: hypothetical protein R3B45_15255 [Bdellovibrionota bacterium]